MDTRNNEKNNSQFFVQYNLSDTISSIFVNVVSSCFFIFVNKILLDEQFGIGFTYVCGICSLHFICIGVFVKLLEFFRFPTNLGGPTLKDILIYSLFTSVFAAAFNASLWLNSLGFYQVSALLIVPVRSVLFNSSCFSGVTRSRALIITAVLLTGVILVAVSDYDAEMFNVRGITVAAIFVALGSAQKSVCDRVLRNNPSLSPLRLTSVMAPYQAVWMLLLSPVVDSAVSSRTLTSFDFSGNSLTCLALSCAFAVLVNVVQTSSAGIFPAGLQRVLGQAKAVVTVLLGLYLGESFAFLRLVGVALAVASASAFDAHPTRMASSVSYIEFPRSPSPSLIGDLTLNHRGASVASGNGGSTMASGSTDHGGFSFIDERKGRDSTSAV